MVWWLEYMIDMRRVSVLFKTQQQKRIEYEREIKVYNEKISSWDDDDEEEEGKEISYIHTHIVYIEDSPLQEE